MPISILDKAQWILQQPWCLFFVDITSSTLLLLLPLKLPVIFFFFTFGFLLRRFTFHRTAREVENYVFNFSLLFSSASQTLRHKPGDYSRELTSAHSTQPESNLAFWAQVAKPWTMRHLLPLRWIYISETKLSFFQLNFSL